MSFENSKCPCGGEKLPGTMLCSQCETAFSNHPAMETFKNTKLPTEWRRHAAITLLTLSRKRLHKA